MFPTLGSLVDDLVLSTTIVLEEKRGFAQTRPGPTPTRDDLLAEVRQAPPRIRWGEARPLFGGRSRVPVDLPAVNARTYFDLLPTRRGPADTLVVYHHGLGEIPHDMVPRLLRRLRALGRCDLVAIKGLHHERWIETNRRLTNDRDRMLRCLVASASLARRIAQEGRARYRHVVMCGISMGGVISLIEACHEPTFDLYVPFLAGPDLRDVVLESGFSRTVQAGWKRRARQHGWCDGLDLTALLRDPAGPPIRPLLAHSDRLFQVDPQRAAYAQVPRAQVATCRGGHITAAVRVDVLGRHLGRHMRDLLWAPAPAPRPRALVGAGA
jgi:hypothetical protein